MRYTLLLPAVAAAAAYAIPQGINFDVFETAAPAAAQGPAATAVSEAPTSVYNAPVVQSSAAAAVSSAPVDGSYGDAPSKVKRDGNCAPQPSGSGPTIHNPDTDQHFENSPVLASYAYAAGPPVNYTEAFVNLNGSTQLSTYMGLYTLTQYSPQQCAAYCNAASGCQAFNLYFERDPTLDAGAACPNPASTTNIKCTLYGSQVTSASATNVGQYRDQFHVVIAGSNGYNRVASVAPPSLSGFLPPVSFSGAIDVTTVNGANVYIGARYFNQPYDAGVCAALCTATTADNRAVAKVAHASASASGSASYTACNYFNAYVLSKNNVPQGLYCSLYSTSIEASASTFSEVKQGGGVWDVSYSWGFELAVQDSGSVA